MGIWYAPAALGVMLIVAGLLIFARPELLAYIVASGLIFAGVSALALAWRSKWVVTYRRFGRDDSQMM